MKSIKNINLDIFKFDEILNNKIFDIIIGTILGDGHFSNLSKSPYLKYDYANKEYAEFVFSNLGKLTENKKISVINRLDKRYNNKIRTSYHFYTLSHPSLIFLSNLFYKLKPNLDNNKKVKIKCLLVTNWWRSLD